MDLHDTRQLLAENGLGRIERCGCGMIHLTVGALTLRLTPEMIAQLFLLLTGANTATAFGDCHHAPLA